MRYLSWTVLALVAYSLVPPLMRVATSGAERIPSDVAAFISNTVLVVAALAVALYANGEFVTHLTAPPAKYAYAGGVALAVGILAYYRALSLGPVSVVTPIFGLFLVLSSAVGVFVLEESFTARKALGVGFAVVAMYLVSVE